MDLERGTPRKKNPLRDFHPLCYTAQSMENLSLERDLRVMVSGYLSEVLCGQIPHRCMRSFARYLIDNRDISNIPSWRLTRCPNYVSSEEIKRLWYREESTLQRLFSGQDFTWTNYRAISNYHHLSGFGSGKGGLGLFEIVLEENGKSLEEFLPFKPDIEAPHPIYPMDIIRQTWLPAFSAPAAPKGYIAVTAGSWGKATLSFPLRLTGSFRNEDLEILVRDLTPLGVGEDYFVAGLRYAERNLHAQIVREAEKEMYQVVWYSPERARWLDMYEME